MTRRPPVVDDDPALRRYLVAGEHVVTSIRRHPVVLIIPSAAAITALALAQQVDVRTPASAERAADILWYVALGVLAWALWRWFDWARTRFVATDKRLLLLHGLLVRKVSMMPLAKVTDMTYDRSIPGRLFGWGTFVLESAGQDQALSEIHFVPHPDANYRAICAELFGAERDEQLLDPYADEAGDPYLDPVQRLPSHDELLTWHDADAAPPRREYPWRPRTGAGVRLGPDDDTMELPVVTRPGGRRERRG